MQLEQERLQVDQLLLQNTLAMMSNAKLHAVVSNNPTLNMLRQQRMNQHFQPNYHSKGPSVSIKPSVPPMLGRYGLLADRMQVSPMLPTNASSGLSKIISIIDGSNNSSGFGLLPNSLPVKNTPEKGMRGLTTGNSSGTSSPATFSSKAEEKVPVTKKGRKKWKKPKDKPNRPLSAYNLFFQQERALSMLGDGNPPKHETSKAEEHSETFDDKNNPTKRQIHRETHGKAGFTKMTRSIAAKWKTLPHSQKDVFVKQASKEKERYAKELAVWKWQQKSEEKRQLPNRGLIYYGGCGSIVR